MARQTESQKLEQQTQEQALESFKSLLEALPDPRRPQGVRYPLLTVVATALMAIVCGCDDAEAMQSWAQSHRDWLQTFLPMPHGAPSQDVYLAVLGALNPTPFEQVLRSWAALLALRLKSQGRHIALDGKTSRGSLDTSNGHKAIHTVSAWLCDLGLVLAQTKTEEKSNEIKAMPDLLKVLDLSGATITIDAMGCQVEIAKAIRQQDGHYLLAVKDNQPSLHQELMETFKEVDDDRQRTLDEEPRPMVEQWEESDKGHGRVEVRRVRICRSLAWVLSAQRWKELALLIEVRRERTVLSTGQTSVETHYYIGSDPKASAQKVGQHIRAHWSIENGLHWVLDMAFHEDRARHRAKNAAQNMTILRHFALNLFKQDKGRKLGIANSRKRAGWDHDYLIHLLTAAAV